jgi:hypothetical protein
MKEELCPKCKKPMDNLGNLAGVVLLSNPPQWDETHVCHNCRVKTIRRVFETLRSLPWLLRSEIDGYESVG